MSELKEHHRKGFADANQRLGMEHDEVTFDMSHPAFQKDVVIFHGDPDKGDIVGKTIPVASIAHLKSLSGVAHDVADSHVSYPAPLKHVLKGRLAADQLTRDHLHQSEHAEVAENLKTAAAAYILGQPHKVNEYEDLINMYMFPGKAVVFTATDLYIKSGQTVVFGKTGDSETYNFGKITVERGGLIKVVGNASLICQQFIQL